MEKTIDTLSRLIFILENHKNLDDFHLEFIQDLAKMYKIEKLLKKQGCKSCYYEVAKILYEKIKQENGCKLKLRSGCDIIFQGKRINEATVTEDDIANLKIYGLHRYLNEND